MVDNMSYTQPYLFMKVLCHLFPSTLSNVLWHLVAHLNLTQAHFFLYWHFYFHIWTAFFHCFSLYFPNCHIILHCLFFLLNNNLFMVFFYLIFKVSALWADDFYKSKCPSVCPRGEYSYEIYKIISQTILTNLDNLHQEIRYDLSNIF